MDGAIASFAVTGLGDLLIREAKSLGGVENQVKEMQTELKRMQCFLRVAVARQEGDDRVCNWIVEIREVSYDAEDVIETYAVAIASRRKGGIGKVLKRYAGILNECLLIRKLGLEIKAVNIKISSITRSLSTYGINFMNEGGGSSSKCERRRDLRRSYSHVEEEDIIGLKKDVEKLVARLVNDEKHAAIWGMGGVGKTTLAKKVYHHHDVRDHFDHFAWVCISQQWQTRDVLKEIRINLISPSRDERQEIEEKRVEEIAKMLYQVQKK